MMITLDEGNGRTAERRNTDDMVSLVALPVPINPRGRVQPGRSARVGAEGANPPRNLSGTRDRDGQAFWSRIRGSGARDSGEGVTDVRAAGSTGFMSGDHTFGVPFAGRHIGPRLDEQRRMLDEVGYGSLDELMDAAIPEVIRAHGLLAIPPAGSEA